MESFQLLHTEEMFPIFVLEAEELATSLDRDDRARGRSGASTAGALVGKSAAIDGAVAAHAQRRVARRARALRRRRRLLLFLVGPAATPATAFAATP